jgi:hypothetical protein
MPPASGRVSAATLAARKAAEEKAAAEAIEREKKIAPLLKELGKDEPAYRKIAEGLANQGIASLKDIEVRSPQVDVNQSFIKLDGPNGPVFQRAKNYQELGLDAYDNVLPQKYDKSLPAYDLNDPKIKHNKGTDGEGYDYDYYTGQVTVPQTDEDGNVIKKFYNKATDKPINSYRFGMLGNGEGGISGGDLFFNLQADKDGKVSIAPDWSPRRHSVLRDIAFPVLALASLAFDWSGTTGAAILGAGSAAAGLEIAGTIAAGITSATGVAVSTAAITAGVGTAALTTGLTYATTGDFESALKAGGLALAGGIAGGVAGGAAAGALPAGASAELTKFVTDAVTAGTSTAIRGGDVSQVLTSAFASAASNGVKDAATEVVGADVAKGLGAATASFIRTGDAEKAATAGLMSGFGSAAKDFLKDTPSGKDFSSAALEELKNVPDPNSGIKSIDTTPAVDTRVDENGLGKDLAVDTRADENGIGSLIPKETAPVVNAPVETAPVESPKEIKQTDTEGIVGLAPKDNVETDVIKDKGLGSLSPKELQTVYDQENPGAANVDVETADTVKIDGKEYFLNKEGGASTQNPDGSYTNLNAEEFASLGEPDEVQSDEKLDTVTVTGGNGDDFVPVAYDDEGNLMPGYELDEDSNPVWVGDEEYSLDNNPDYVSPEGEGMFDDGGYNTEVDVNAPLELPPGAEPDDEKEEEPYLLNPDEEDTSDSKLPKVPPIFPPKTPKTPTVKTPTVKPLVSPKTDPTKKDDTELGDLTKTLIGGTVVGKAVSDLTKTKEDTKPVAEPLAGKYSFNWNQLQTKAPEKGVAYGQRYYGNHWQAPVDVKAEETKKDEQPNEVSAVMDYAEGGLMALDKTMMNTTFKPTMTDSGISADQLSKNDVTNQVIQHMRRGGHVIDPKLHREVSYLAGKGEPVHHIVGFMNHRKRMAEGGITSHSLGSYSDGGHLLKGPGDGMSDDIPATIADKQPARLANEEFVIPADVVSHLGNGSSESGAKVLYEMMARIRKARTGNPKQGKQINPHKLLPKV